MVDTEIWVNIGSGHGSLPDGTEPLSESMSTYHQLSPVRFFLKQFHDTPQPSISEFVLKITCLKFHSNLSGTNELMAEFLVLYAARPHHALLTKSYLVPYSLT